MTGVRPETATAGAGGAGHERPGSLRRSVLSAVRTGLLIVLLLVAYGLAPWDRGTDPSALAQLVVWLVVIVAAVVWQIRAVLRSSHPWLRAVEGAVIGVALLLVPFATAYAQLSTVDPATFTQ